MKVYLDTVGCRLNQAEIETIARQFRAAGHEIVANLREADLAVINTCMVTGQAAADSRAAVRRAHRQGAEQVLVTGCWASLAPEALSLPGVVKTVVNRDKDTLVATHLGLPQQFFDVEPVNRKPLPGPHARTRAFIKAQDGCDNACTYCITTIARGRSRSRPVEDILRDIRSALDGGAREIVLTGVHLGAWGRELKPARRLTDLVEMILKSACMERLRLSSLEPWDLDEDFFSLWQDHRLCRHLHMPLQSGSKAVLERMQRKTSPEDFLALMGSARRFIPDVAITTDVMVGFPGETEKEFMETVEFARSAGFSGGHVFPYSARPGTAAAGMDQQVRHELRKKRSSILRSIFSEEALKFRRQFLGNAVQVLWEATDHLTDAGWQLQGLTDNNLRVFALSPLKKWNEFDRVKITSANEDGLAGEIQPATV